MAILSRAAGDQQYKDLQKEAEGGGIGDVDGTGDEDVTELESEERDGVGSRWVILDKEAKKERKRETLEEKGGETQQNQRKPEKQRLKTETEEMNARRNVKIITRPRQL